MFTPEIKEIFKNSFEPELMQVIEAKAKVIQANAGDIIIDYGQIVRYMPILTKGTIKISRIDEMGKEIFLYFINANESCAMTFTCCMQQFPSEIKATAEVDVEFIGIPIQLMDEWLTKYPTWKSFVMKTIRNRFNEMLLTIDQLAFQKLDERLINYLKEKSKVVDSTILNISHEEIANDLASSREVISRLLKKLEHDQKVILYRNQIKIMRAL